jgi:hypothetical protein
LLVSILFHKSSFATNNNQIIVEISIKENNRPTNNFNIRVFTANSIFVKEISPNQYGNFWTMLDRGKYYFCIVRNKNIIQYTSVYDLSLQKSYYFIEEKLAPNNLLNYLFDKEFLKDFLKIVLGILFAYCIFLIKSFRSKRVLYKIFIKDLIIEQNNLSNIFDNIYKEKSISDKDLTKMFYDDFQNINVKILKIIATTKQENADLLTEFGHRQLYLLEETKKIFSKWDELLNNSKSKDEQYVLIKRLKDILNIIYGSLRYKYLGWIPSENIVKKDDIILTTLIQLIRKRRLKNKIGAIL